LGEELGDLPGRTVRVHAGVTKRLPGVDGGDGDEEVHSRRVALCQMTDMTEPMPTEPKETIRSRRDWQGEIDDRDYE
jgi:hypothetical protein